MKFCFALFVVCAAAVAQGTAHKQVRDATSLNGRSISASLFLNNPYNGGDWGPIAMCATDDSYVHAFEIQYQDPAFLKDATALNILKLYCSLQSGHDEEYITSATANSGTYRGMRVCGKNFVTGFRAQVLSYQGLFKDDVAVQDVQMECSYGDELLDGLSAQIEEKQGDWSVWTQCPHDSAVCGLQTRVETPQLLTDNTAVTDITIFCCPLGSANSTQEVNLRDDHRQW